MIWEPWANPSRLAPRPARGYSGREVGESGGREAAGATWRQCPSAPAARPLLCEGPTLPVGLPDCNLACHEYSVTVTVTGASRADRYALCSGSLPRQLRGLTGRSDCGSGDNPRHCRRSEGMRWKLKDGASLLPAPTITEDLKTAFGGTLTSPDRRRAAAYRGHGARRPACRPMGRDLRPRGKAINEPRPSDIKVLGVGKPANTNALIAQRNAPDGARRVQRVDPPDHNHARVSPVSAKLSVPVTASEHLTTGLTIATITPTSTTRWSKRPPAARAEQ